MSFLNDHQVLEELRKIRQGYDRMQTWVVILAAGLIITLVVMWSLTGRVRWVERKWDQGKVLVIEKEHADEVREELETRRRRRRAGAD
jgi:hypothetical protein